MNISRHAEIRCQQRAIRPIVLDLILHFGTATKKPGSATELRVLKKDRTRIIAVLKRLIHDIEKTSGKAVVTSDDDEVLTVYHLR